MTKIVGIVGKLLKADRATTWKERMIFVGVLVAVILDQPYPQSIMFENEIGKILNKRCIMSGSQHYARNVTTMGMRW